MKYLQTFEYQVNTKTEFFGKMYNGRFTNVLKTHCNMLNRRSIKYDIWVDEDKRILDLVYIIIKNEYIEQFHNTMSSLGYRPFNINKLDFSKLKHFDTIQDYLKTKD